ncbi:uncharacterized protein LOC142522699 [Primulina tabacum]|uniref:uncharacterized protein LOC142522699 n=1 Tax=Primulina tabacum TaxID=48773 RepID=UPI003F5A28D7
MGFDRHFHFMALLKSEIEPQAKIATESEPGNDGSKRAREEDGAEPNEEKRIKAESVESYLGLRKLDMALTRLQLQLHAVIPLINSWFTLKSIEDLILKVYVGTIC